MRVPPKLMAGARRSSREPGKSDPIDALAVARAALREPDLPTARLDGVERDVRLLVDHRDDLVAERTRAQNRLRWHLHELSPGDEPVARGLDRYHVLAALETRLAGLTGAVARIAADLVVRIRDLTRTIEGLEREIARLVAELAPSLLALQGCGPLTAAKLVGEVAGIGRFRSKAAFARHDGTAPVPVWSGNETRHRLNRGGNRQLNVALHRIAITQLQRPGRGQDYVAKRMAGGDTKTEAIRALRRRISDEVYRRMRLRRGVRGRASWSPWRWPLDIGASRAQTSSPPPRASGRVCPQPGRRAPPCEPDRAAPLRGRATSSASSVAPSSSPGSWTGASSRSAGMARVSDERRAPNDYRWARQVSAMLLIAVVVVIVVLDVIVDAHCVCPTWLSLWLSVDAERPRLREIKPPPSADT